jgi:transcriptional regulator with XRE-family HTH domain
MDSNERIAHQAGAALRRIRTDRGLAQHAVAERAGISTGRLSLYENGRQLPTFAVLVQVLAMLSCSAEEFGRYFGPWGAVETLQRQQGAAAAMAAAGRG